MRSICYYMYDLFKFDYILLYNKKFLTMNSIYNIMNKYGNRKY